MFQNCIFPFCTESGLDGADFIHISLYYAVLWINKQNSADNTSVLALNEQCQSFLCFFGHAPPAGGVGVGKSLKGDTAGTADPN